jgi:hypothetical protein
MPDATGFFAPLMREIGLEHAQAKLDLLNTQSIRSPFRLIVMFFATRRIARLLRYRTHPIFGSCIRLFPCSVLKP